MSSAIYLTFSHPVPVQDWLAFCGEHDIVHSEATVGGNVFYSGGMGGVQICAGEDPISEGKPLHIVDVETFYGGDLESVAQVARWIATRWPCSFENDPELSGWQTRPASEDPEKEPCTDGQKTEEPDGDTADIASTDEEESTTDPEKEILPWTLGMSRQEDALGLWEVCTHGIEPLNKGFELYMRNVPSVFLAGAGSLLNRIGIYLLEQGPVISAGETFQAGRLTMVRFLAGTFGDFDVLEVVALDEYYDSLPCECCGNALSCKCCDDDDPSTIPEA